MPPRLHQILCLFFIIFLLFHFSSASISLDPPSNYLLFLNQTCQSSEDCARGELVCVDNTCKFCSSSHPCELQPTFICSNQYTYQNATVGICKLKSLFPLAWNDIVASIICFVGGGVAASAGIGGGGIFNPTFLLTKFPISLGIPFSTAIIFGAAISNILIFSISTHPKDKKRPVIDYHFTLLTLPIVLSGAVVGVFLNGLFPNWLIVILLFGTLMFASYKSFQKGIQITKKLNKEAREAKAKEATEMNNTNEVEASTSTQPNFEEEEQIEQPSQPTLSTIEEEHTSEEEDDSKILTAHDVLKEEPIITDQNNSESLQFESKSNPTWFDRFLQLDDSRYPIHVWIPLFVVWCAVFLFTFLRGSKSSPSVIGIVPCSWQYWLILVIQFPFLYGSTLLIGFLLKLIYNRKVQRGTVFLPGQVQYTWMNALGIPMLFFIVGISGSLIGIGGGMLASPVMLSMGQDPSVVVATSALMVLFTASISVVQFIIIGRLPWDYTLWFFILGMISGLLGQLLIGSLIKKFNKAHWIVFVVATVILLSALAMTGVGIYDTIMDFIHNKPMGFKPLCS